MHLVVALLVGTVLLAVLIRPLLDRARSVAETGRRSARRERDGAAYWAAVRHDHRGLGGVELQEAVCRSVGCSPAEADAAIGLLARDGSAGAPRRL